MSKPFNYADFDDLFLQSADDFEPYGALSPESLIPADVESAWRSTPPLGYAPPEDI